MCATCLHYKVVRGRSQAEAAKPVHGRGESALHLSKWAKPYDDKKLAKKPASSASVLRWMASFAKLSARLEVGLICMYMWADDCVCAWQMADCMLKGGSRD